MAQIKGARTWPAPRKRIAPAVFSYQGTSFFRPFFFLLLDSFLSLSVLFASPFAGASADLLASSGFAGSAVGAVAAPSAFAGAVASGFAGVSAVLGAEGAVFGAAPPAAGVAAAGAGCASPVAGGAVTLSVVALPPLLSPTLSAGVALLPTGTVATSAVLPPGVVAPAGFSNSPSESASDAGSICGVPLRAATTNSAPGPLCISASGFFTRPGFGRGAFCSAVIHATAAGSACGTGILSDFNLSFASGTSGERG